ncbi:MAG: type II toxin-antitoxin system mRNA interferase toxin, RelE/StbE family [Kangiellaceae bacterium]|jgi:plasmid stabilization system protein ParE|nr:type II toxin-antitoxin system mRNA interferase toxin, RelE/StbE family [Kangiellaceae bacterium]|tara:strand:+ start:7511 stop:7822 length:312 start_codon:yes stop_codon:yes gene_type:complete
MALVTRWTNAALDDINYIAEYIAKDSIYYAKEVASQLFDLGESAGDFPNKGRVVPELGDPSYRELFLFSYRLIYEITPSHIQIIAVIHGRRLLEIDERISLKH